MRTASGAVIRRESKIRHTPVVVQNRRVLLSQAGEGRVSVSRAAKLLKQFLHKCCQSDGTML